MEASALKLVSTGHGWGANNTGNAAEFHRDEHHIWVGGVETFSQDNWNDCNPNPDACSPQNGTWIYDRAGWCPGSIAQWFDYDMTPYISNTPVELKYIFDEDYVDLCHPNNPGCISGTTCTNCDDGFNPHLIVKSHLISFRNAPFNTDTTYQPTVGIKPINAIDFVLYPNPSTGKFNLDLSAVNEDVLVSIIDIQGQIIETFKHSTGHHILKVNLSELSEGIYLVQLATQNELITKKVIIER